MINIKEGNLPHIGWIDLKNNGILSECAIMKTDGFGNIYFFEVNKLDNIDKKRLVRLVTSRNAESFELWDLMSQITLNNGVNALEYFHQLVRVISPDGVIYSPKSGVVGSIGTGEIDTNDPAAMKEANARADLGQTVESGGKKTTTNRRKAQQQSK